MKNIIFLFLIVLSCVSNSNSQVLSKEGIHDFESLKKNSYLGNVEYDVESKVTSLFYVEKNALNTIFTTYNFDEDLNFIDQVTDKYTLKDAFSEMKDIGKKFKWFNYKGEIIEKEIVTVDQGTGGKLIVRKTKWTRTYDWSFGNYNNSFENLGKMKVEGLEGQRIYLYDRFNNSETGEVVLLVGIKPPKGQTKGAKFQHARKFQFLKIKSDFTSEYGDIIEFDHNMSVGFIAGLNDFEEEGYDATDISLSNVVIVFSPTKSPLGKKWQSDNPEKQTMIMIDAEGKIASRIDYEAPTSGWVIEDFVLANNGADIYFYGPAKDEAYVNSLMPTNSPLTGRDEVKDIKYKNFQIMKVTNNEMVWISNTDLKEFQAKSVTPPSQKKSPDYKGKNFVKNLVRVTTGGELFIAGQIYTTKQVLSDPSNPESAKVKVIDDYKDLVMFQFDKQGKLKSQFGIKRDKNNKYSKGQETPQYLYENEEGTEMYWVYGEIQGLRKGFEIGGGILEMAGVQTVSKRKLLFYPTVAKIDLEKGSMGDFVPFGANEKGKQIYFTNPEFPQLMTDDFSNLIFVGENKKGSLVWLAKMEIN